MEIGPSGAGALGVFNPWAFMGEHYPDWNIRFDDLFGIPEIMCWRRKVVLLEHQPGIARRRASLTHAIGHIHLLHKGAVTDRHEEAAADRWAAKMLIDLTPLADALAWHGWDISNPHVARELKVDQETLMNRVRCMHPAEVSYLKHRRAEQEHAA